MTYGNACKAQTVLLLCTSSITNYWQLEKMAVNTALPLEAANPASHSRLHNAPATPNFSTIVQCAVQLLMIQPIHRPFLISAATNNQLVLKVVWMNCTIFGERHRTNHRLLSRSQKIFSISDMLLHFKTRATRRRLGSKIEAKLRPFYPLPP